jgi:hypothetical protein
VLRWLRHYLQERKHRAVRRKYKAGAQLTEFVAPDVKRDVEIVDVSELELGYVTARIRTWNLMHVARGLATVPAFGAARRVALAELWTWTGERWGGAIPEDDITRRHPTDR